MYSSHYFVEKTIKERQKQFLEEAKRLHLLEAAKSPEAKNRKRIFGPTDRYFKDLALVLRKKYKLTICGCHHV
jgi:hypothetical protein